MTRTGDGKDPMDPTQMTSLKHWGEAPSGEHVDIMRSDIAVDCGWGRLLFGQTYDQPAVLARALVKEHEGQRDVGLYVRDPNVVISLAPQQLFLDPSLTFRLPLSSYEIPEVSNRVLATRPAVGAQDEEAINRIYKAHSMVPVYEGFLQPRFEDDPVLPLVAVDPQTDQIVGAVTAVDHKYAIDDPDNGGSLWALAVDHQFPLPGVGMRLVNAVAALFKRRGRAFFDLSVMHDNEEAIALYRKLGFEQVPVYCLKNRNSINERLFVSHDTPEELNIYASIIIEEARRRGIAVEIENAENGFFRLSLGGHTVSCRESLSDRTTAVAMSRCDDKAVTRELLMAAGLRLPAQRVLSPNDDNQAAVEAFLEAHGRVVVKPARGEQGRGVVVDLRRSVSVLNAIKEARSMGDKVLLEEFVEGEDLRVIVIDGKVVAAAVRRRPVVIGDGKHTISELITKLSRRRAAATSGESRIPLDAETERTVRHAGHAFDDILEKGRTITVRKTANLHTGGTIHDVTCDLHGDLEAVSVEAARVLDIPVVGLDLVVPDLAKGDYRIIEANERPGLANHEPQPTAERFIDFLFPQTRQRTA